MKKQFLVLFFGIILFSSSIPLTFNSSNHNAYAEPTESDIADIGTYSVYGLKNVVIGMNVTFNSGSVGAHNASSTMQLPSNAEVWIKDDANFVDPDSAVVGDTVLIKQGSTIQNVFFNELQNDGTLVGTSNTPLTLPVADNLPDFPNSVPGTLDVSVAKNSALTIQPGQYDEIFVDSDAILTLAGGIYNVTSISAKKDSQILFDGASEVVVSNQIKWEKGVRVGPADAANIDASDIVIFVGGNADINEQTSTDFGKDAVIDANIFAPNGEIKMDKGTIATGSFIAETITIEKDSVITLDSVFGIISIVNDLEDTVSEMELSASVMDEAVIVDISKIGITDLQNDVDSLVTNSTVNHNLSQILLSADSILNDASVLVTDFDESGANSTLTSFQNTMNDFVLEVEAERGLSLSNSVADDLVNTAQNVISNSQLRDDSVVSLVADTTPLPLALSVLQNQDDLVNEMRNILLELEDSGVTVNHNVVEGSLHGEIVAILTGNPLKEIAIKPLACSSILTTELKNFSGLGNPPFLDANEEIIFYFTNLAFCSDLFIFNPFTTPENLFKEGKEFWESISDLQPALSPSLGVTMINQPDLRIHWLLIASNLDSDFGINIAESLVNEFIDVISGAVSGKVFSDFDQDGEIDQDPFGFGEQGLGGWTLNLTLTKLDGSEVTFTNMSSSSSDSTLTGNFAFDRLATGNYVLEQVLMPDFIQTSPSTGFYDVSITAGSDIPDLNFGNFETGPILFEDFDDGVSDWSQLSCNIDSSIMTCGIRTATGPTPVPSPPNWGAVEVVSSGGISICPARSATFSQTINIPETTTYDISSWMFASTCNVCDVKANLIIDNSLVLSKKGQNQFTDPDPKPPALLSTQKSLSAGPHEVKLQMTTTHLCSGSFRAHFDDLTIQKASTVTSSATQTGGPYFYVELNQTSVNATRPDTITIPLSVNWMDGFTPNPVSIMFGGNGTVSSTVTSVQNTTSSQLFDVSFDVPSNETTGQYEYMIVVKDTETDDYVIEDIIINVE